MVVESVQKCLALTEMGEGLLSRIYFMKSKLLSDKRQLYMGPDYLHRFRVMITKNFPKIPSRRKLKEIPGGESFASNAVNNCRVLSSYRDLVYDMVDFAVNSSAVLTEMPKTSVLTTQLERNREVVQCYLGLLKAYMRVMTFFSTLKEGKTLYALYAASVHYLHHSDEHSRRMSLGGHIIEKKYTENANILFSHMEDTQRHFIDTFNAHLPIYLKPMLLNMRVTLWAGEDLLALEGRKVFDPVNAGASGAAAARDSQEDNGKAGGIDRNVLDTQPSVMPLNTDSALDMYSELCSLQAYKENVVFACLAAPSLLLEPDVLDLLRHVIEHTMVLPIFRDFNLMIHPVLEELALSFPHPALDPLVTVPKGYKLKTTLKHIARHAAMTCPYYHAQRRVYLTSVLQRIHALLEQSPGLVGPKMPLITAVASLSREEVLWYYRHQGKVKIRRDCKKFHNPELYVAYDIAGLVGELCRVTATVRRYQKLIINYYSEYLSGLHFKKLIPMLEAVAGQIDARVSNFNFGGQATAPAAVAAGGTGLGGLAAGAMTDDAKVDELLYLKRVMNPLVEDLVKATTTFSQRPDFKALHKSHMREKDRQQHESGSIVDGDQDGGGGGGGDDPAGTEDRGGGDADADGLSMDLYRMHAGDRKIVQELRRLARDPFSVASGAAPSIAAGAGAGADIALITGDTQRLDSFRRNWIAASDHLNRALEILTLESNTELEQAKRGDETAIQTVQTRRKDTLTVLTSASQLLAHMRTLVHQSRYVDSLPLVFESCYEPHDVWWFRESFVETFYDCIEGESEDGSEAKYALAFLWIPSMATRALHADCPQEAPPLTKSVIMVAENLVEDYLDHFGDRFQALSGLIDGFKQQTVPVEAANRLQRMIVAREEEEAGGDLRVAEPYPGFESRPANKESSHEYSRVKANVVHLVRSASEFGQINVFDRHYTLTAGLVERASEYVKQSMLPTFFDGVHHTDMKDISEALRVHRSAVAAFQVVARHADLTYAKLSADHLYGTGNNSAPAGAGTGTGTGTGSKRNARHGSRSGGVGGYGSTFWDGEGLSDFAGAVHSGESTTGGQHSTVTFDLGKWYRELLFLQGSDPSVPFPGTNLPTSLRVGGNTLAWKYSVWFTGLASQIASGQSGLVYLPQLNSVGTLTRFKHRKDHHHHHHHKSGHKGSRSRRRSTLTGSVIDEEDDDDEAAEKEKIAVTSYITIAELCAMCQLLGPHGVRTVDAQLLRVLCYMVNTDVLTFVEENTETLRHLAAKCSLEGGVHYAHHHIIGMHRFVDALTTIGFIITLRRMLYQAQGLVVSQLSPSVSDILRSVSALLDPLSASRGGSSAAADLISLSGAYTGAKEVDLPVLMALEKECFDPCPVFRDQKVRAAPKGGGYGYGYGAGLGSSSSSWPKGAGAEQPSYVLDPGLAPSRRGSVISELSADDSEELSSGAPGTSVSASASARKGSSSGGSGSRMSGDEEDSSFRWASAGSKHSAYMSPRTTFATAANMANSDFFATLAYGKGSSSSKSTKFVDKWELLPAALACVYLSDLWEHTHYFVAHDCFSHNEHLLPDASSVLLMACMGRDGYAQYLHILKKERERLERIALARDKEAEGGKGFGVDADADGTDSVEDVCGVDGGNGSAAEKGAAVALSEIDSRRVSAATLVSAAAASQAGKLHISAAGSGGGYLPSEHANTDRSLIRKHLQAQAEGYIRISSSILLYLQGKGRLSANKIMAEAMDVLRKEDGVAAKGKGAKTTPETTEVVIDESSNTDSATFVKDCRFMYKELYASGRAPSVEEERAGNEKAREDREKRSGRRKKSRKKDDSDDDDEDEDAERKLTDRERHRAQSLNPTEDDNYDDFSMRPVSGMARCLEKFVLTCPVASRAMLETYYPYSLLHAGITDAALGKLRELDERNPFPEKR